MSEYRILLENVLDNEIGKLRKMKYKSTRVREQCNRKYHKWKVLANESKRIKNRVTKGR